MHCLAHEHYSVAQPSTMPVPPRTDHGLITITDHGSGGWCVQAKATFTKWTASGHAPWKKLLQVRSMTTHDHDRSQRIMRMVMVNGGQADFICFAALAPCRACFVVVKLAKSMPGLRKNA